MRFIGKIETLFEKNEAENKIMSVQNPKNWHDISENRLKDDNKLV